MSSGWTRIGGERRRGAFEYGFVEPGAQRDATSEWVDLGPAPLMVRPLRLSYAARVLRSAVSGRRPSGNPDLRLPGPARALLAKTRFIAPFGGRRQAAVREIVVREPRVTRLWERFCVDVGVARERDADFIDERIFGRRGEGYRVLILEDGDRYAIRAMCIFLTTPNADGEGAVGRVIELLHDRSVAGMRAASHLLALAVREMFDAGADSVRAWSLAHSGTFPIFARHAFLPLPARLHAPPSHFVVRALEPDVHDAVVRRDLWYLSYLDDLSDSDRRRSDP